MGLYLFTKQDDITVPDFSLRAVILGVKYIVSLMDSSFREILW